MKKGELGIMPKSLATFSIPNSSFSILREARPGIFGLEKVAPDVQGFRDQPGLAENETHDHTWHHRRWWTRAMSSMPGFAGLARE